MAESADVRDDVDKNGMCSDVSDDDKEVLTLSATKVEAEAEAAAAA
jgi:hypothetical protein